jgi:sugar O-acyltransferase (sialic acid O-acetyltransferase NeuD family)
MNKVAIIGYSGHAFVVADTLQQSGYTIIGYFEKGIANNNPLHLKYLGYEKDFDFSKNANDILVFPAIGDNNIRKRIINYLLEKYQLIPTVISPKANISDNVEIDIGTLVCQGSCINPFVKIGKGVIINTASIIEHECSVGDFSHIAPGAVLAGNVNVGESAFIGANATIKQGITIGNNVIIGAGSVVLKNVADNECWVGNPARKVK